MSELTNLQGRLIRAGFVRVGQALARWTRLEYHGPDRLPPAPALLVGNHGFGGIFDVNAFTIAALVDRLRPDDLTDAIALTHELAWTLGVGPILEPAGFRRAGRQAALDAFRDGSYVVVLPGGDVDAAKDVTRRNTIEFAGRTGFAGLAIEAGVPIVPIVVSGAGETALVLYDGQGLARLLRLPQLMRVKAVPVSVSVPWGLSVGVAGMAPYFPLPAKMRAAVLDPIVAEPGETEEQLAARVHAAMSDAMTELTEGRIPFLGIHWPRA